MAQRRNLKRNFKIFELNKNENTSKLFLRRKYIALNAYIRKEESSKINNLSFYLGKLVKDETIKPNVKEDRR